MLYQRRVAQERLFFLDALRGFALILMVLNHTGRWWQDGSMGWPRYHMIYISMTVAAPLFLFLVGFCVPLSSRARAGGAPSAVSVVRKYGLRGARLVLAGLALNLLVFPDEPLWSGGVLQTIGLGILASIPALFILRRPRGSAAILALSAVMYLAFAWSFPRLVEWLPAHPVIAQIWFFEFAPWPWVALVLIGLALGSRWVEAAAPDHRERYLRRMAWVGAACLVGLFGYDWWAQTAQPWMFKRDFILNRHWIPRGATTLWCLGLVFCLLPAAYYLVEVRRRSAGWLVALGRTALPLYFGHHLIVLTLVNQWLGLRFNDWGLYTLMNALLLILLVSAGRGWLIVRRTVRERIAMRAVHG